jgi:hypothetical protein
MAYSTSLISSRSGSIRPRPLNEATSAKKIVQFCPVQRAGRAPVGAADRDRTGRRITGSRSSVSRSYTWRSSTSSTLG